MHQSIRTEVSSMGKKHGRGLKRALKWPGRWVLALFLLRQLQPGVSYRTKVILCLKGNNCLCTPPSSSFPIPCWTLSTSPIWIVDLSSLWINWRARQCGVGPLLCLRGFSLANSHQPTALTSDGVMNTAAPCVFTQGWRTHLVLK